MRYKVLSLHHEEENALLFSAQRPSRRFSLFHLICVLYRIGPCLELLQEYLVNRLEKFSCSILQKKKNNDCDCDGREALLTDTLGSGQLYLRPPPQNPVSTPIQTRNFTFPVSGDADTFKVVSRGCRPTRASTV